MKIQVISKNPIFLSINHGMCHINREMVEFNQNLKTNTFTSIVKESAFKYVEEPILDENGDETEETLTRKVYVQEIRTKAHKISYAQADGLFTAIGNDIEASSESFVSEFDSLKMVALLLDTQNADVFNTTTEDWELDITNQ